MPIRYRTLAAILYHEASGPSARRSMPCSQGSTIGRKKRRRPDMPDPRIRWRSVVVAMRIEASVAAMLRNELPATTRPTARRRGPLLRGAPLPDEPPDRRSGLRSAGKWALDRSATTSPLRRRLRVDLRDHPVRQADPGWAFLGGARDRSIILARGIATARRAAASDGHIGVARTRLAEGRLASGRDRARGRRTCSLEVPALPGVGRRSDTRAGDRQG